MRAVYPGSFDPIHLGHIDVIERMSKRFDEVIVLISHSGEKSQLFTPQERKNLIEVSLAHIKNIKVDIHSGLTVDYLKQNGISTIVRGLRAVVDFEYEMTMASMNRKLNSDIETLLMFASPDRYYISSRGVKEVAKFGGDLDSLVTSNVIHALRQKLGQTL
ncbi:MAG: pantetheine-phosphate adenylyltransferase [Proteobacteria bacterium]|jgi:pantetheine-phosphate adenylyltransferase|nr:pantetheine-phosphate adenylyltransferase [Pseudomonadota bacterium]